MGRKIIIDVDTAEYDTTGYITNQEIVTAHAGALVATISAVGETFGWDTAEFIGGETCAAIGKCLDQQKP